MITYDSAMEALKGYQDVLDHAEKLWESYVATREYQDPDWFRTFNDLPFYACHYDSENIYFSGNRERVVDNECMYMPLAYLYSPAFREQERLVNKQAKEKSSVPEPIDHVRELKLRQYYALKKELGL